MDFRQLTGATMSAAMMRQMYDNYADKAAAQVGHAMLALLHRHWSWCWRCCRSRPLPQSAYSAGCGVPLGNQCHVPAVRCNGLAALTEYPA